MAISATIAGATSNSYVTLAETEAYFAARLHAEAWETATDADKEKALLTSCRHLEACRIRVSRKPFDLSGVTYDPLAPSDIDQALSFPRKKDKDAAGNFAIPKAIKEAQCEEALAVLAHGQEQERRRALQAAGVTSFSVDGLTESYGASGAMNPLESAEARNLLAPYLERGGVTATSDYAYGEWSPACR